MSLRLILLVSVSSLAITAACARHHAAPHALGKHVRGRAGCRDAVCSRFLQQIGSVTEGPLSPPAVEGAALAPAAPFPAPVIAEAQPAPTPAPVNLEDIETVQNQVAEKLKEADAIGSKLEEAVNELNKTAGANERKGVDYSTTLINPPHPAPEATIEAAAESALEGAGVEAAAPSLNTAPVVVLLSPEPSSMEKLEFARAIACRGKMNTAEMRAIRTAKLAEMAAIKGTTSAQLEEEIKDAEARLEESKASRHKLQEELRQITSNAAAGAASKADMVFLKDDLRLEDEKIKVISTKLQNMQDRLAKLRAKEAQAEGTFSARGAKKVKGRIRSSKQKEDDEDEED